MPVHVGQDQKNKNQSKTNTVAQRRRANEQTYQLVDNRPEATAQRELHELTNNSPRVSQLKSIQAKADNYSSSQAPIQRQENNAGLPDDLKSGIENMSGYSMDDVKVHRNSSKPKQLGALAYAQGTDIHLASGQEKHLPHEAWHVVQQKQGRVKPTMQMKGKVNVNDDAGLEREADMMGAKALSSSTVAIQKKTEVKSNISFNKDIHQKKSIGDSGTSNGDNVVQMGGGQSKPTQETDNESMKKVIKEQMHELTDQKRAKELTLSVAKPGAKETVQWNKDVAEIDRKMKNLQEAYRKLF